MRSAPIPSARSWLPLLGQLVVALAMVHAVRAERVTLTGEVVDKAGRPVAGAEVSNLWLVENGRMTSSTKASTDAAGRFSFKTELRTSGGALVVLDAAQERGALVTVTTNHVGQPLRLELEPLVTVRGEFTCPELGAPLEWSSAILELKPDRVRLIMASSDSPKFQLKAPPGSYELHGYGDLTDVQDVRKELLLRADQPVVDLGKVPIVASPIGMHYGKPAPPWHITEARGVPPGFQLSDLRGRWVLVEFWGFW